MIIDSVLTIQERRLESLLATGLEQARRQGRPILVSTVLRAPQRDALSFFGTGAALADDRLFWSSPRGEYTIAGVDAAWSLALAGPRRFADAAAAWHELCATALIASTLVYSNAVVLMPSQQVLTFLTLGLIAWRARLTTPGSAGTASRQSRNSAS